MATEKTPAHQRISRAENSAAEWKMKAIERREAVEALKGQLATSSENTKSQDAELNKANKHCVNLEKQIKKLTEQLRLAHQTITTQQTEMNEFKKNSVSRRRETL